MTTDNDPLDGFHPGIRTFFLEGSALAVQRSWNPASEYEPDREPEFVTRIVGRCALAKGDHVRIVGSKALVREFDLSIDSDVRAAQRWKSERQTALALRRPSGDDLLDKLHDHFFQVVLSDGDKVSPTAHLSHHPADRDVGHGEIWSCSVMAPTAVVAALEADLMAGRVETINVSIKWSVTLVADEYSPISATNIWGVLPNKAGFLGERLVGHLSGLWWRPTLGPIVPPQTPPLVEADKRKRWP